ncbi:MAG: MmgE/PrpD family protein, partial [Pseudomonadota bacterium]
PSVVIFPALWAVAATRGAIPGETAAAAYAAGFEAIARLGEAFNPRHYDRGWHGTGTLGAVGAAAAAARLIGLDQARFAHALSLALSQAGGLVAQFGSAAKPAQAGFAARAGVVAALMAEQGVEGRAEALDAPNGYAALVAGVDPERLDRAIARLDGRALADWGVAVKPYPCCGYLHRLVACAERLAGAARPEAIAAIRAELPDAHRGILIHDRPRTASEARFSLPFAVAAALIDGGLALERFAPAGIEDPAVRALMAKIEIAPQPRRRPELNSDPEQPDRLRIVLVSGEILEAEQGATPGSLDAPLGRAAIEAKFRAQAGGVAGADWSALSAWDRAADFAAAFAPFGAARRDAAGRADPTGQGQTGGAAAAFVDAR